MKFLGIEFGKKKSTGFNVTSDSKDKLFEDLVPSQPKKTIKIAKIPRIANPIMSFKLRSGVEEFEQPEYNMAEVGRIGDVEAYVQRSFTLKEGLMFKEGWEIVGKNLQTIKYIKQRFEQINAATGMPFHNIFRGLGEDLIQYSNAFLVKVRNVKASGGKARVLPGSKRVIKPVAGYFPIPVSTMRFKRDDNGKILKYRQLLPTGKYRDFDPNDIIHIYFRKKKGFLVGTPCLIPVKDDIRALRRIEENIEMLIYQHLFPLYHYKVGTENAPARNYPDGSSEIDIVKQEVEIMPAEGMIVTPERHDINAVGSEARALRAEGYLKHFKQRIFAGLGVSSIDVGEGETANRSTSDSMSRNLVDDVKHYQRTLEIFVNEYIIKELLLESEFIDSLEDENLVQVKFNEIDLDAKIKVENHAIQAFSGHAIKHSELRRRFGNEPLTDEEWYDTYWKLIEEPKMLIQAVDEPWSAISQAVARAQLAEPQSGDFDKEAAERKKELAANNKPSPSTGSGKPGPKSTKQTSGQRSAKAATTPSNQHGTKTSPEKRKSSYVNGYSISDMVAPNNQITYLYNDLRESTVSAMYSGTLDAGWFKQLALATGTAMKDRLFRLARIDFRDKFRSTGAALEPGDLTVPLATLEHRINRIINRFINDLINKMNDNYSVQNNYSDQNKIKIISIFDSLSFRSRFVYNSERNKARNYGIARGLRKLGDREAKVITGGTKCEKCSSFNGNIDITNVTIDDVPGFHPNCTCTITKVDV